jgi:hypothetical protein
VGIKLKNMNRNTQNWLRATIYVIGGGGSIGIAIWGLVEFYKFTPEYFNYTAVGLLILLALFTIIKFIKDGLDDEDASDKYWEETYPSYSKAKQKKETHKEFMERLDDAWERDFGKK